MKTALILGISGQDGAYLAELLLKKKYRVWGSSRDHESKDFINLRQLKIEKDVRLLSLNGNDFRSVISGFKKSRPDEIYNLSGQSSVGLSFDYPVETFESNLIATINLLEAIRIVNHRIKFYHAGSSEAFGNTVLPATETTPYHPKSPYSAAKAAAHYAVSNYREAYEMHASTGILFNHESPLRGNRFVTKKIVRGAVAIAQGKQKSLILGNLKIQRDWGWAPEYVEAMWHMLQAPKPDDYVVATGKSHSLLEFVRESFSVLGLNWRRHVVVSPKLLRPTDLTRSAGNPSKIKNRLGWKARTEFKEIVQNMIQAELSQ